MGGNLPLPSYNLPDDSKLVRAFKICTNGEGSTTALLLEQNIFTKNAMQCTSLRVDCFSIQKTIENKLQLLQINLTKFLFNKEKSIVALHTVYTSSRLWQVPRHDKLVLCRQPTCNMNCLFIFLLRRFRSAPLAGHNANLVNTKETSSWDTGWLHSDVSKFGSASLKHAFKALTVSALWCFSP